MDPAETRENLSQVIARFMEQAGWTVVLPTTGEKGYALEASKGSDRVAVQVIQQRGKVRVPQIEQFLSFLERPEADRFTRGLLVTGIGYAEAALAYFASVGKLTVRLAVFRDGKMIPVDDPKPQPRDRPISYIGVFTCKGGVGKTTISAHLAGAFALSGYDVALIDLDPQKNLSTLLGGGITVSTDKHSPGNSITIYPAEAWNSFQPPSRIRMVVCDCSPVFEENPIDLVEKFAYCLIPTTLNPLGLNKNGQVIRNTLQAIRRVNQQASLFVLINNYFEDETHKGHVLKEQYQRYFAELSAEDKQFYFIDPSQVAIRNSKQLFYWGYHIYSGTPAELAFASVGGRCLPKADFLNLVDYLENHADLQYLKP
jgi:chromosome partitioning protein